MSSVEEQKILTSEDNLQTNKVFLHVDADCFYAQVEELRNKALKHVPLGVTQKYLVVTCNYLARERGVRKLMGIAEAKSICPEIRLVNGEDLTPYREYSDAVAEVLQTYGPIKKVGSDEMFVDVTDEARKRLAGASAAGTSWKGHIFIPSREGVVESESSMRIMDLRAKHIPEGPASQSTSAVREGRDSPSAVLLKVGSEIAWEARRAIKIAVGVRTSAGIAHSMLIAKLISGLHKPDDQTILLAEHAREFVGSLSVRALVNVGSVLQRKLKEHGIVHVSDMWDPQWTRQKLIQAFGERQGNHLYFASQGQDYIQKIETQRYPKSISVEDSFKECSGFRDATRVVERLCPDLMLRLRAHFQKHGQVPRTLTITWRRKESGVLSRTSASTAFPRSAMNNRDGLSQACMHVLRQNLKEPFHLSLISLTAKRFHLGGSCGTSIASYFERNPAKDAGTLASKHSMRMARESSLEQHCGTIERDTIDKESENIRDDSFWADLKKCDTCTEGNPSLITKRLVPVSYMGKDAAAIVQAFQTGGDSALHSQEGDPKSIELAIKLQKEEYEMSTRSEDPKKRQRGEGRKSASGKRHQKSILDHLCHLSH